MIRRFFTANTLFKRLLVPYLLTAILIGGSTLYNILSINSIVSRINATYQSNADLFDLGQVIGEVQTYTESYLSTRSSAALENYYRASEQLTAASLRLNDRIIDSDSGLLQRNIRRMITSYTEQTSLAITAKRGRDVAAYTTYYDRSRVIFGYIRNYTDRLNAVQFQLNYNHYKNMGQLLDTIQVFDLLIMAVILVFNMLIVLLTALRITRPVAELARTAKSVASGNLSVEPVAVESHDEVNILARAFNSMIISLRAYVEQIRVNLIRETQQKEHDLLLQNLLQDAQLKNLQAQINPHFLFNALNAGVQMAMMEGAERTSEFVEHVADFYRYNINIFDQDVALAQEVKMVEDYFYIQKVRFADRIHFESDIDASCLKVRVPGLILQPLVENAFAHGLRDMEQGGRIWMRISDGGDRVMISIRDNGKGMTPEKIAEVLAAGNMSESQALSDEASALTLAASGTAGGTISGINDFAANGTISGMNDFTAGSVASSDDNEAAAESDNPDDDEESGLVPGRRSGAGIALTNVIGRLQLYYHKKDVFEINSGQPDQGTEFVLRIPKILPDRPAREE
jgi:two-component system sensor histidine kinase YesM